MTISKLKIFYLKKQIVFPNNTIKILINKSKVSENIKIGDMAITFPIRSVFDILFHKNKIATRTEILEIKALGDKFQILIKGIERVKLIKITQKKEAEFKKIKSNTEIINISQELKDLLKKKSQELIFLINVPESDKLINLLNYLSNINHILDFITNYFILDFKKKYIVYNEFDIKKKVETLIKIIDELISLMKKNISKEKNEKEN